MRTRGVAVILLCVSAITLGAQAPAPASSALIVGRVLDAESKTPLPGVLVQLGPAPDAPPGAGGPAARGLRVLTDPQGRFVFRQLPAGRYALAATMGGNGFEPSGFLVTGMGHLIAPYLNGGYGQRRPEGPLSSIALGDGETMADADILLWKTGGIDGAVRDEAGEPLVGLTVAAVRRAGDGALLTGPTTRTDDRGEFHFGNLAPGSYVVVVPQSDVTLPDDLVSASDANATRRLAAAGAPSQSGVAPAASNLLPPLVRDGRAHVYRSTFHPATAALAEAATITVRSGEIVPNIDVSLQPVPATRVSGVIVDAGVPVPGFGVRLLPIDSGDGAHVLDVAWTATDPQGRFEFAAVAAGSYRVLAQRRLAPPADAPAAGAAAPAGARSLADQRGAWAALTVSVGDAPLTDLVLPLQPPRRLTGRVLFAGVTARPDQSRQRSLSLNVSTLRPVHRHATDAISATIDYTELSVVFDGLAPGRYLLGGPDGPPGWSLQSATLGGRDIVDAPFDVDDRDLDDLLVTFTDSPAEVSGTVSGAVDDVSVFLFPADRTRWVAGARATRTMRTVRPDGQGRFSMPRMIPGEYLVIAVSETQSHAWPEAAWLTRAAAHATTVRVMAGQQHAVSLSPRDVR